MTTTTTITIRRLKDLGPHPEGPSSQDRMGFPGLRLAVQRAGLFCLPTLGRTSPDFPQKTPTFRNSLQQKLLVKGQSSWKILIFHRKYVSKWWVFHCHVRFSGDSFAHPKMFFFQNVRFCSIFWGSNKKPNKNILSNKVAQKKRWFFWKCSKKACTPFSLRFLPQPHPIQGGGNHPISSNSPFVG